MRDARAALLLLALTGCGAPERALVDTRTMAVAGIRFEAVTEGVVAGFDLDGVQSPDGDPRACGHGDHVDPAGVPGIDNQFAGLFELADAVAPGAVASLVQQNIDDGLLILLASLDRYDDGSLELVIRSTAGDPLLGSDGRLLDGQTFDVAAATEVGRTASVRVDDAGLVEAGPLDMTLTLTIFARVYTLTLGNGQIRYTLTESDAVSAGVMGGALPVEQILTAVDQASAAAEADYRSVLGELIADTADLEYDRGACQAVSAAIGLEMVAAFAY